MSAAVVVAWRVAVLVCEAVMGQAAFVSGPVLGRVVVSVVEVSTAVLVRRTVASEVGFSAVVVVVVGERVVSVSGFDLLSWEAARVAGDEGEGDL